MVLGGCNDTNPTAAGDSLLGMRTFLKGNILVILTTARHRAAPSCSFHHLLGIESKPSRELHKVRVEGNSQKNSQVKRARQSESRGRNEGVKGASSTQRERDHRGRSPSWKQPFLTPGHIQHSKMNRLFPPPLRVHMC